MRWINVNEKYLDFLREFEERKNFSIVWPGKYDVGHLFYENEGYKDYKIFEVSDYDITCIIKGGKQIEYEHL